MKIFDAVHKFIHFSDIEAQLIDSKPFQRLRYIHQLGVIFLVYPGATNKRFEHSLGTMNLASQIFDLVIDSKLITPQVRPYVEELENPKRCSYWRQVLRLAALCHDLGHLPFSHVAEDLLLPEHGHELMTLRLINSDALQSIWEEVPHSNGRNVAEDIAKLAIGYKKLTSLAPEIQFSPCERVLSEIITGDDFGADRIDYLLRDASCTGLAYGLIDYHQIIETLCFLPVPDPYTSSMGPIALGFNENGLQAVEALLMARYFMHSRVYQHPKTMVHSHHLKQFMYAFYREQLPFETLEVYLKSNDYEVLTALHRAATDPALPGHHDAVALQEPGKRFRYLPLRRESGSGVDEVLEMLASLKQELGAEFAYYEREFKGKSSKEEVPALCQLDDGRIVPAFKESELYSKIPYEASHPLVYVAPTREQYVRQRLA